MAHTSSLTEASLERVIPAFYARVRKDDLIGPVFNDAIDDWGPHLEKLIAFWSSVMLTSGRYKGNPVAAHAKHARILTPDMFERWLALWRQTTNDLLPVADAQAMQAKAERISESLKLALWFKIPQPDHRNSPATS
ncbi:group III truncated hemoglobin [Pacificimonas sp. WHA3]|uniref:Group III truncated hemoglobin n=1 Tax=Pacificimonas pallii TaxID=2827236 RepID=A0ABS6SHM8_9SPHN|nr:group III truncated hemoglobin [Pacificimonas pallii]MBV7257919.1 group III truncated hemoglobin [Pacificimonas pallii]